MVLQDHFLVVAAELVCKLRHCHHQRIVALRRPVSLIGTGRRCIGVVNLQVICHIRTLEQRQRLGAAVHRDGQAMVAVWTGVRAHFHEDTGNPPVLHACHLHTHPHRMTSRAGNEFFFPGISAVNRSPRHIGRICGQILDQNILLRSVAAADSGLDDMNPVLGQPRNPAHNSAHVIRHLGGGIDGQTAALHSCKADMRLQRCMLDLAGLVCALHNSIRLCERFLHIPDAALVGRCDVVMNVCT